MNVPGLTTVQDDLGNRWVVEPGDPGRRVQPVAKELRIKAPAYPYEILMGKPPEPPNWTEFEALALEPRLDVERLRRIYVANLLRKRLRKEWTT